jgi:uncharacterized repeat protein (TIGR04138 family)
VSTERFIVFDFFCRGCRYNLRGLPAGSNCPECGKPAPPGVATREDLIRSRREQRFGALAARVGCSLDALLIVLDAWQLARERAPHSYLWGTGPVSTDDVCRAFCHHARGYFNDPAEGMELLREWGICGSKDLGRILFGLVNVGALQASPDDRAENFVGKFTIETVFERGDDLGSRQAEDA